MPFNSISHFYFNRTAVSTAHLKLRQSLFYTFSNLTDFHLYTNADYMLQYDFLNLMHSSKHTKVGSYSTLQRTSSNQDDTLLSFICTRFQFKNMIVCKIVQFLVTCSRKSHNTWPQFWSAHFSLQSKRARSFTTQQPQISHGNILIISMHCNPHRSKYFSSLR